MDLLILGGGVFLGAATLDAALVAGHRVTVFNRGRSRTAWPGGVEVLRGDRATDLSALHGRRWDAVIDTCGYVPVDAAASAAALHDACDRYLFVSSISAYASFASAPVAEEATLASAAGIAPDDRDLVHYGAQKSACEAEVERSFGERALIVRPGLIVGPGDRSGRFSYWPWRAAAGGEMLVPAVPADEPLQFIDVRDLGAWMVTLLERGARSAFNATGPTGPGEAHATGATPRQPALTWAMLIEACTAAAARQGHAPARPVAVDEAFLQANGVEPWTELPLWLPSNDATLAGHSRIDLQRAASAGLRTRALDETVTAVLREQHPAADDPRLRGKLTRTREAELLALWRSRP